MDTAGRPGGSTSTDLLLEPGTLVNGLYRLVRLVGVGGMGEVWEARHERTKGRVALKLLLPEMGRNEQVLLRFQREVEITSGLNHPNIVRVSDADKLQNGRPFLVMEFLEGRDLSHVSRTGKPLGLGETLDIIEQTAMGLEAAHRQSVIHRDLKPANLFVVPLAGTRRTVVKILDFGISKALDGLGQLTQSRSVMGTPNYMAPEQATGGASSVNARADQFSLAAIAYELFTGRMAFAGDGMVNVIYKVVREMPPSFSTLGLTMPAGVEATVMRGLAKAPADRFGSVLEFSDELKRTARQTPAAPAAATAAAAAGAAEGGIHAGVPGPPLRQHPSPGESVRLGAQLPTTLRASAGQLAAVRRMEIGAGARAGERGRADADADADADAEIPAGRAPRSKAMALVISGAALGIAILVGGVAMRGPAATVRPMPGAEPLGSTRNATPAPIAAVTTAPGPTVARALLPAASAVPAIARLRKHEAPSAVEHQTPATVTEPGAVEEPGHLPVAVAATPSPQPDPTKPERKKTRATSGPLPDGHQTAQRPVKPPTAIQRSEGLSGPLNNDL